MYILGQAVKIYAYISAINDSTDVYVKSSYFFCQGTKTKSVHKLFKSSYIDLF